MLDLSEILEDTKRAREVLWELLEEIRGGKKHNADAGKVIAAANGIVNAHKVDLTAYHVLGDRRAPTSVVIAATKPKPNGVRRINRHIG